MPDRDDLCLCGHMAMNHWTSADGDHLCDEENGDPDCLCKAFTPAVTAEGSDDNGGRGWEATATGWRCTECHAEVAGLIDAATDAAHRCATAERGEG